ncbi:MAG: putative rhamnosyl transferase [Sulfitobacter sp.]
MQVIGLCRFSYPAIGGFQVEFDTLEERIAYLYAPARMAERFATFETFTLPSLRAQSDPDFTFLVVIGDQMPQVYRQRLEALLADMTQAVVQAHPPKPHRAVMKEAINSQRRFDAEPCLQFRMDDDDAVGVNFVARLRETAEALRSFAQGRKVLAIDFNQGFIARPGPEGIAACPTQAPYQTAGLALMVAPKAQLTVMNFSHVKMPLKMATVTLTGEDMLVRGHNEFNDSRQGPKVRKFALEPLSKAQEQHFKTCFNIDADQVRREFTNLVRALGPRRVARSR